MQPRPRRIREELLDHGWWLVPLVLLVWFRQLELPTQAPGPTLDESLHAVKGWELLTVVRLGIDSVCGYGRLGWFHGSPELEPLFAWKFWGWEIGFKLALVAVCAGAVLRTEGRLARVVFALALLSVSAGFDALACVALLALFQGLLGTQREGLRGELALLLVAALLAQVKFTYFLLWAAGLVLLGATRGAACFTRGLVAFLFLWILFGQSPLGLWPWLQTSFQIASGYNEALSAAGPAHELWLSLAMLALLLGVLVRGAQPRALQLLVLATALIAWRTSFTRPIGNTDVFFSVVPVAACFALRGRASILVCAALVAGGNWGLRHAHPSPDPALSAETLRDLCDPAGLQQRIGERGAEFAAHWDLQRVRERTGEATLDVFQNSAAIAILNGFNFHPRPVFQSYSAYTPELLERNRAFYEGERAPLFVLYRSDPIDGRLAPAEDAKALDELLLRYKPCFEERGWLLLEREQETPRTQQVTTLATRSLALGEWIEFADAPGNALELRLDPRLSTRGRLESLLLRGPELQCEFERADGSRARARMIPGAARAGFLVRPFVETQAELTRVFLGRPVPGLARLRLLAAPGEDALWDAQLASTLLERKGLLPPARDELALAFEYPDFNPPPAEVACAAGMRNEPQAGRSVHVFPAPAALRWHLEPGAYRLRGTFGMLDAAWQEREASDGALVFVVLQQGRESTQLYRRLLEPRSVPEDRGDLPLELEFEVREPADLYLRMRTGWQEDPLRDWVYWEGVRIEPR